MLPKRYRDVMPQPPPSLPPSTTIPDELDSSLASNPAPTIPVNPPPLTDNGGPSTDDNGSPLRRMLRTPKNIFGLLRQYFSNQRPATDPEELVTLPDLSPSAHFDSTSTSPNFASPFYPFPNESSFRLGHWYWNEGVQKSKQGFKQLLEIVGDPTYDPNDVRNTKWDQINQTLGCNKEDGEEEGEWMDEDAGWKKTRIKISVPFHRRMKSPGAQDYVGADLYHRSLVDVMKERIADPHMARHFHLEPYELFWKPTDEHQEVKIHGEIYASPAFLQAHQDLQNSPPEPDCDLPRVVVALMFYSDSTHLTSFGHSQLWPCYLFFGNESKYRRCKPSCNLCSHVAYFQKVGGISLRHAQC
jgi:hypothetical protein